VHAAFNACWFAHLQKQRAHQGTMSAAACICSAHVCNTIAPQWLCWCLLEPRCTSLELLLAEGSSGLCCCSWPCCCLRPPARLLLQVLPQLRNKHCLLSLQLLPQHPQQSSIHPLGCCCQHPLLTRFATCLCSSHASSWQLRSQLDCLPLLSSRASAASVRFLAMLCSSLLSQQQQQQRLRGTIVTTDPLCNWQCGVLRLAQAAVRLAGVQFWHRAELQCCQWPAA
jgi:hypothetical protein